MVAKPTNPDTDVTTSTGAHRSIRRLPAAILICVATLVSIMAFGASPASAEQDTLARECISYGGVRQGCSSNIVINWGAGIGWSMGATVQDTRVGDRYCVMVVMSLDRISSSNTRWQTVSGICGYPGQTFWPSGYSSLSGYDPTRGAWFSTCIGPTISSYTACTPTRYVQDNS